MKIAQCKRLLVSVRCFALIGELSSMVRVNHHEFALIREYYTLQAINFALIANMVKRMIVAGHHGIPENIRDFYNNLSLQQVMRRVREAITRRIRK